MAMDNVEDINSVDELRKAQAAAQAQEQVLQITTNGTNFRRFANCWN